MARRVLLVILLLARAAAADNPRLAAEQLFQDAQRTHDEAKFVACGKAYLDLYNHDPAAPDGDEVLYNGAVCFQYARSVGSAITTYELILRTYPRSKLAGKALMQSGSAFLAIARFDDAAARFEEYAKRFAGEKDARDALENAITLRTALGDRAKRIEDTSYFVKLWGARVPGDAADAMLALVSAYDTPEDQVRALRDFVKTFGGKAGGERLAAAYGRLGDALWRQSCPTVPIDGLCMKVARDKTVRCDGSAIHVETVARTAAVRNDALAAYGQAIKIVDEAGLKDPASVHVAAMARIARADDDLEHMIGRTFPTGLDFDPAPAHKASRERSTKRFADWLADETKAGEGVSRAYEQVLAMKDAASTIAAAARLGQVSEVFSRALVTGEIPKDVRSGEFAKDKRQVYCQQMTEASEPLVARAVDAFTACVDKAAQLGVFDDWVGLCRREGHALAPAHFPPPEVQPQVTFAIGMAVEPPVRSAAPELAAGLAQFAAGEQAGWTEKACRATAATFAKQARSADALYMTGLSFHRCGLAGDARRAYEKALEVAPDHAASRSNLGELAWRAGQRDPAMQAWQDALAKNGKLFAAHLDLALAGGDKLRALPATDPARKPLASEADFQARNALALAPGPLPLVVLAMLAADSGDKRQLDVARALVDQAMQIDDQSELVYAARAVLAARRGDWTLAYRAAERAATLAPTSEQALRVAGLVGVHVGLLDTARTRLAGLKAQPYEIVLARAIAARGLGDPHGAETLYQQAIQLDPARAEAHYDLGLLYELHAQPAAPARAIDEYRRAAAIDPALDAAQRAAALRP